MSRTNRNLPYDVALQRVTGHPERESRRATLTPYEILEYARKGGFITVGGTWNMNQPFPQPPRLFDDEYMEVHGNCPRLISSGVAFFDAPTFEVARKGLPYNSFYTISGAGFIDTLYTTAEHYGFTFTTAHLSSIHKPKNPENLLSALHETVGVESSLESIRIQDLRAAEYIPYTHNSASIRFVTYSFGYTLFYGNTNTLLEDEIERLRQQGIYRYSDHLDMQKVMFLPCVTFSVYSMINTPTQVEFVTKFSQDLSNEQWLKISQLSWGKYPVSSRRKKGVVRSTYHTQRAQDRDNLRDYIKFVNAGGDPWDYDYVPADLEREEYLIW